MNTIRKAMTSVVGLLIGLLVLTGVSGAQEFGSREEAKAMVEKAAAFLRANGAEKAIAEFNSKGGQFIDRDLYVVMAKLSDGVRVAHGANPKMIGKSLVDFKDVEGKSYGLEILDVAKTKGTGWVDYKFSNPVTKKITDKTSYVMKVDDHVVFVGAYTK
ncbi:Histidine kinase [Azospirillaceae bacterium]